MYLGVGVQFFIIYVTEMGGRNLNLIGGQKKVQNKN